MEKPNAILENELYRLDRLNESQPFVIDPEVEQRTIRYTIILLIASMALTALLYFVEH